MWTKISKKKLRTIPQGDYVSRLLSRSDSKPSRNSLKRRVDSCGCITYEKKYYQVLSDDIYPNDVITVSLQDGHPDALQFQLIELEEYPAQGAKDVSTLASSAQPRTEHHNSQIGCNSTYLDKLQTWCKGLCLCFGGKSTRES